jgi:hypothetical protein
LKEIGTFKMFINIICKQCVRKTGIIIIMVFLFANNYKNN